MGYLLPDLVIPAGIFSKQVAAESDMQTPML